MGFAAPRFWANGECRRKERGLSALANDLAISTTLTGQSSNNNGNADYAVAAVLRDWKHSRQNTGRPCVGRKGTVVCLPHPEHVAWVSTFV